MQAKIIKHSLINTVILTINMTKGKIRYIINNMSKEELLENARLYYTEDQVLMLDRAIDIATEAHANQKRASGDPYITHPLAVASFLISWGMDINSIVSGVLHDTVEDTSVTIEYVEETFGKDIANLVNGLTKVAQVRAGMLGQLPAAQNGSCSSQSCLVP